MWIQYANRTGESRCYWLGHRENVGEAEKRKTKEKKKMLAQGVLSKEEHSPDCRYVRISGNW